MKRLALVLCLFLISCVSKAPAFAEIKSFEECVKAGNPVKQSLPLQCTTAEGRTFTSGVLKVPELANEGEVCKNLCGDGKCQEMVCMAVGCPCAETQESCPVDCKK